MKLNIFFAAAIIAATIAACGRTSADNSEGQLETGDLIFVGIPMDYDLENDSMASAISKSTGDSSELNIIHVAIAEVSRDSVWIIDATIKHGVDRHPLDTFLTDFTLKDGSYPVFEVKRLKDDSMAEAFVENAKTFLGLPYDVAFLPDNGAMYCSELVRESYITPDGEYIFSEAPMNFTDPEGNMPLYWEQLFAMLGMPVPQGINGTNPQQMSKEDVLMPVNVDIVKYSGAGH